MVGKGLINHGHVAVALKFGQMSIYQIPQFPDGGVGLFDLLPETVEDLFGFVLKKLNQNVILVFEIEVYRPVGNSGFPCDLGNGRQMKSFFGKDFDGGFKDAWVFITCFGFRVDRIPP
jgi:hypothetical protein